jgi:hypothetical protein
MPDDTTYLRERLGRLGLATRREEEIFRELGDHLVDHAAALEARGLTSDMAAREALDSVSNWPELRNEIVSVETEEAIMNYRTKVLWLPALCAFALSMVLLALLQIAGFRPRFYWLENGLFIPFYVPWLLALPIIGAVAAFWSKRAGGGVSHRLLVSQAPAIIWLAVLLTFMLISLVIDRHVPLIFKLHGMLIYIVAWVLLPAVGLLLGAAPFLRKPQAQP